MRPETVWAEPLWSSDGKRTHSALPLKSFAFVNLGYHTYKELGPAEIVYLTPEGMEVLQQPADKMKICSFLWVYYGYPTATYEGVNVEQMRYKCGDILAQRDDAHPDLVAGVPGFRHCPCSRLCKPLRNSFCTPVYQIHADLAAFFHADQSEPEKI